ncbi:MAG: pantoate--beta-alanine ligase [Pseudomonadales bacterium]|nr:pantoate--beta-alanine ligase [Pseudomonadales bacterium]
MRVFESVAEYRAWRKLVGAERIGFVPTMGALHIGHQSLLERSVADNDVTVLSIYVNPTQFDNADDLNKYPDTLAQDLELAESLGVDVVIKPTYEQMYADDFRYLVDETHFSKELCGAHRDGHFTGVLTIVMKLLNLVKPHSAYFGEKDYQQLKLIRDMVAAFFMDVEIVGCPTVREPSGLAFSSRNLNLNAIGRKLAPSIYREISSDKSDSEVIAALTFEGFAVDYCETRYGRRFVAARVGEGAEEVRLIDNVPVTNVSAGN